MSLPSDDDGQIPTSRSNYVANAAQGRSPALPIIAKN
jgi:hypothetical protein